MADASLSHPNNHTPSSLPSDENQPIPETTGTPGTPGTPGHPMDTPPEQAEREEQQSPKQLTIDEALDSIEIRGGTMPKYKTKFARINTFSYHVNNTEHSWTSYAHLRILNHAPGGTVEAYADTCSPMSIMSHKYRQKYYPDQPVIELAQPINIGGMGGKGPLVTQYVSVPVNLLDRNKVPWQATAKAFLVDKLRPGFILGVEFLKPNKLNIKWGSETQNDTIQIGNTDRAIWATSLPQNKPKLHRHKTFTIRAASDCLVQPSTGVTLPVEHPHLPLRTDGYLISATPIADRVTDMFGSLMNAITDGQDRGLPFANFGSQPILLRKGDRLATIQAFHVDTQTDIWNTQTSSAQPHGISLADILDVSNVEDDDEPDDRYGHGYPFHLPDPPDPDRPASEPIDMSKVDMPDDWPPCVVAEMERILNKSSQLFRNELGRFNDGIDMPIKFKDNANIDDLHQRPYRLSRTDMKTMNAILDPLRECGVVEQIPLGQPVPIASPAFVVWRKGKPRVVVDLRKVNMRMIGDAYPLPRQDDILSAMHGATVFTVVDVMKGFFQQGIPREDRWKTAFVTPHRGHEQFTVATMGLKTSPGFYQHRMERLLAGYLWQFVLVYIDDVIIYSKDIYDHLKHLDIVFSILAASGCTMSLDKCHFAQHGLEALGVHVSRLGLSTTEEKVAAIRELDIPTTLYELECGIGLMGFHRHHIHNFAGISDPINEIKTIGFKDCGAKANPARRQYAKACTLPPHPKPPKPDDKGKIPPTQLKKHKELVARIPKIWKKACNAWQILKDRLCEATALAHPDPSKPYILRVDSSRRKGVGAGLHQLQEDGKLRPILFLSRLLTPAERRYGICEIETCGMVWALKKLMHLLDHQDIYVYTDHNAIVQSFTDAQGKPKGTDRLMQWRLFLSRFAHRLKIFHIPGSKLVDADALSRLPRKLPGQTHPTIQSLVVTRAQARQQNNASQDPPPPSPPTTDNPQASDTPPDTSPASDTPPTPDPITARRVGPPPDDDQSLPEAQVRLRDLDGITTATMHISDELTDSLVEAYKKDRSFRAIYTLLTEKYTGAKKANVPPPVTLHLFRLDPQNGLLYFMDPKGDRLVIPSSQRRRIMEMAHDNRAHPGIQWTYDYLRSFTFFPNMKAFVTNYIKNACPQCALAKPDTNLPYGDLQPIDTPIIPLNVLCLDFIVGLPVSKDGNDAVLLITDKTSKFHKSIIGKTTFVTEDWAKLYILHVYPDWGLPDVFISDVDSKFLSDLWTNLCKAANISIKMAAAYHHPANGQIERSVQTFMMAMITLIGAKYNPDSWEDLVGHVTHCLNTSTSSTTRQSPYEILFGRKPKSFLPVDNSLGEPYAKAQQTLRQEAADATALAQAKMKIYYDRRHRDPPALRKDDLVYIKLSKPGHTGYHLNNQTKLSFRKVGPFPVEEVLSKLRYKIKLPPYLQWRPEISIENLIPARADLFNRPAPEPGGIIRDGQEKFIIESIQDHAMMKKPGDRTERLHYKIKWLQYDECTWEPAVNIQHDVPKLVEDYHSRTNTTASSFLTIDEALPNMGF